MTIELCTNNSEVNKIKKNITTGETLSGALRNESNVINPVIRVATENPSKYNYAYIPEFNRYYFIRDMKSIRAGIWELSLQTDPLMSFADKILACSAILNETTVTGANNYLPGRNWIENCKSKTDIINFSSGLLEDGQFILITAGG